MRFPFGVTVTHPATSTTWASRAVWPDGDEGGHEVVLPYGEPVQRGEVLQFNGHPWLIVATPKPYRNPFTGWAPGNVLTCLPALAQVTVRRPGVPVFNAGRTTTPMSPVWSGVAVIQRETSSGRGGRQGSGGARPEVAEGEVSLSVTRTILLPSAALVTEGDQITVDASPDPLLTGSAWWVSVVSTSSIPSERELTARSVR